MSACSPTPATLPPPGSAAAGRPSPQPAPGTPPPAEPPAKEDPRWQELVEHIPEAAEYVPIEDLALPDWALGAAELWLRWAGQCRPLTRSPEAGSVARLEVCRERFRGAEVVCDRSVEVGERFRVFDSTQCRATLPDGSGGGMGSASSRDPLAWQLAGVQDERLDYTVGHVLEVEPAALTWVSAPCTADSVARLEARLAAEGLGSDEIAEVAFEEYGVLKGQQRCQRREGLRLVSYRVGTRRWGDRGVGGRTDPTPRDCTRPCPGPDPTLVRFNEYLDGRAFRRRSDRAEAFVFRTESACLDDPASGIAGPDTSPCQGAWLDSALSNKP